MARYGGHRGGDELLGPSLASPPGRPAEPSRNVRAESAERRRRCDCAGAGGPRGDQTPGSVDGECGTFLSTSSAVLVLRLAASSGIGARGMRVPSGSSAPTEPRSATRGGGQQSKGVQDASFVRGTNAGEHVSLIAVRCAHDGRLPLSEICARLFPWCCVSHSSSNSNNISNNN
ncbi:unnamed protein product [Lampetra planeri]